MYSSFYTGALGAKASLNKLDVVGNNLANINKGGFKPKTAVFSDLIQYNLNDSEDAVTELQAGAGVRTQNTYTTFAASTPVASNSELDFAIMEDNSFFMVRDRGTNEVSYTRDGHFHRGQIGDRFYLMTDAGKLVLDRNKKPIVVEGRGAKDTPLLQQVGVYTFENPSRLMSTSNNEYVPSEDTMRPSLVKNPELAQCALESSGTDMSMELTRMIESQRAYSYALKMVLTSDEIVGTINSLKG